VLLQAPDLPGQVLLRVLLPLARWRPLNPKQNGCSLHCGILGAGLGGSGGANRRRQVLCCLHLLLLDCGG
jgi:hypothetical protein